jgi:hypothetical protein
MNHTFYANIVLSTIMNSKPFIVAIGRDVELMNYSSPDLFITSQSINTNIKTPILSLNDDKDSPNDLIYDTTLMEAINGKGPEFSKKVIDTIDSMANGREVIITAYYNAHTDLLRKQGYTILGSDDELVHKYSKKSVAYTLAKELDVPVAPGELVENHGKLRELAESKLENTTLFVASDDDPFFPTNKHIYDLEQIKDLPQDIGYLVTEWQEPIASPNVQLLINDNNIVFLGIADQIIRYRTKYDGNTWPSTVPPHTQNQILDHSMKLAEHMYADGYRGFVGFDWVVSEENKLFFIEINPRKNRSSGVICSMLDQSRPQGVPSIFELEMGIIHEELEWSMPTGTYWAMDVYDPHGPFEVIKDIIPAFSETDMFKPNNNNTYSIIGMPPKGAKINKYPDYARVLCVSDSREKLAELQDEARSMIDSAVKSI